MKRLIISFLFGLPPLLFDFLSVLFSLTVLVAATTLVIWMIQNQSLAD